jgi:hypothetical protein
MTGGDRPKAVPRGSRRSNGVSNSGKYNSSLAMLPPDRIEHIRDVADEHAVSGEQLRRCLSIA